MSGRRPSQVVDRFWVHAHAPDGAAGQAATSRRGGSGKWLLFAPTQQVDEWWDRIRAATEQGRLGYGAKVATARPNRHETSPSVKVICVYTHDWLDRDDVSRVLGALRDLGVPWRLSYKTDDATTSRVYGRGASIYVSPPGSRDFRGQI